MWVLASALACEVDFQLGMSFFVRVGFIILAILALVLEFFLDSVSVSV
jgi:hypothetical protein